MITNGCADDLSFLWKEYKLVGGDDLRNRLVEEYLPIAKYNAERAKPKLVGIFYGNNFSETKRLPSVKIYNFLSC